MYFAERNDNSVKRDTSLAKPKVDISSEDNKTIYGINELSYDITSMLNKVALVYKSTLDLKKNLSQRNDIVKGAITQSDIRSMIKIISQDINGYMSKMQSITNKLRKSYLELENKKNIILVSAQMDDKYKSVFNKSFLYKNLNIYMDKYLHEKVNSGVFLITLDGMKDKPDVFITNTHSSMLKKIYPELRYLDVVARISDNMFAVLIVDVSQENFIFMLKQILKKIKVDGIEQACSAGMMDQFDNNDALMKKLEKNLENVKHIKDDFILA